MVRAVEVSAGGVYDLGLHVVWCPKYRRRVLDGPVGVRLRELIDVKANQLKGFTSRRLREEFPYLRSRLPTLWSRSFFVASVGAVSAAAVQRYIDTQYERPWRKENAR
jgi:putative transposase